MKKETKKNETGKELFQVKTKYNWLSGLSDGPISASKNVVYNTLISAKV